MTIIYAYRDAREAIQKILDENVWGSEQERRDLADLCEEYLEKFDERENMEDEESEDE